VLRLGIGLVLTVTLYVVLYGYPYAWRPPPLVPLSGTRTPAPPATLATHQRFGVGIDTTHQPRCAVEFLAQHGLTGRAFVPAGGAEWLVFRLWPRLRVSNDSRLHVYGPELLTFIRQARTDPAAMAAYLQRWHPNVLLIWHLSLSLPVYKHLMWDLGWM
jgi:hypothetical protein